MGTIRRFIDQTQFEQLFSLAEKCSSQINRFIAYLSSQPNSRRVHEDRVEYIIEGLER